MSEATPTTDQVRRLYAYTRAGDRIHRTDEYFAQFDRWIERVRADERERCVQIAVGFRLNADVETVVGLSWNRDMDKQIATIRAVSEQEEN